MHVIEKIINAIWRKNLYDWMVILYFSVMILYGVDFFAECIKKEQYVNRVLREGAQTIATIIYAEGNNLFYDIEYDGKYYYSEAPNVKKRIVKSIWIGEHFYCMYMPEELQELDGNRGTPHMRIILSPYPADYQDTQMELERIREMYKDPKELY